MEMHSKVSDESKPLKKAIGAAKQANRPTNTKLGLCSSNTIINEKCY